MNNQKTATLSVCMIVKDEAKVLARCLESINGLYQQLCIVDTGSTDNTVEIAKGYTQNVEVFTDCNDLQGRIIDFALARSKALTMANGDWVLQIDADEVLNADKQRIIEHINNTNIDRVAVAIGNDNNDRTTLSGRLFRRANAKGYLSRIHEYLDFDGNQQIDRQITIINRPDKTNKESASERNMRLCQLMLEQDPENSRTWYYLAREQQALQQFQQAAQSYDNAQKFKRFTFANYQIAYNKASCLFLSKQLNPALKAVAEAIEYDPRYAESYCLLGDIYFTVGKLTTAAKYYQYALECKIPEDAYFPVLSWAYKQHPSKQLAIIEQKLSNS